MAKSQVALDNRSGKQNGTNTLALVDNGSRNLGRFRTGQPGTHPLAARGLDQYPTPKIAIAIEPSPPTLAPGDADSGIASACPESASLSAGQKRELATKMLQETPEKPIRQIAARLGVTHKFVKKVREKARIAEWKAQHKRQTDKPRIAPAGGIALSSTISTACGHGTRRTALI
jgi:hypothetical protein